MTLIIKIIKYPPIFYKCLTIHLLKKYLLNTNKTQILYQMLGIKKHIRQGFSPLEVRNLEGMRNRGLHYCFLRVTDQCKNYRVLWYQLEAKFSLKDQGGLPAEGDI